MTALRTTRQAVPPPHLSLKVWATGVLAVGLFGCGSPSQPQAEQTPQPIAAPAGTNDPAWLTSRDRLPAPPLERLDYDPAKRTLSLYELPGRDVWMVQLPDELQGRAVGPTFRLPEGTKTDRTLVYYSRPGVKASAAVTVAAIEAGRRLHSSAVAFGR